MSHCAENGDCCEDRLAEGPDDLVEDRPVAGAVHKGTFLYLVGNGLNIGLDENNVVGGYDSGDNIYPESIGKTQHCEV